MTLNDTPTATVSDDTDAAIAPATPKGAAAGDAGRKDFDPKTVDAGAFTAACQEAARPHKAKIVAAAVAAKAKHGTLMLIVVPCWIILGLLIILCIAAIFSDKGGNAGKGIGGLVRAMAELGRWARRVAWRPYWDARRKAKEDVLTRTLPTLGLTYKPGKGNFPVTEIATTGLISSGKAGEAEDYISGTHGGAAFQLCERVPAERKGEEPRSSSEAGWQGLLLAFDLKKSFSGTTLIVRDGGKVGNFFKGLGKIGERIELEDPRFEKRFEVFGSDQVEARYLLTPAFMERMVELDDKFRSSRLRAAFSGGRLFIAIDSNSDRFELGFDDGALVPASPRRVLRDLEIPCRIIDALNLTAKTVA